MINISNINFINLKLSLLSIYIIYYNYVENVTLIEENVYVLLFLRAIYKIYSIISMKCFG